MWSDRSLCQLQSRSHHVRIKHFITSEFRFPFCLQIKGSRLRRDYSAGKGVTEESEALNLSQERDFLSLTRVTEEDFIVLKCNFSWSEYLPCHILDVYLPCHCLQSYITWQKAQLHPWFDGCDPFMILPSCDHLSWPPPVFHLSYFYDTFWNYPLGF